MSKHTPGPWTMSLTHNGEAWDIEAKNGSNIALVKSASENGSWDFVHNASLICFAPDLFETLKLAAEHLPYGSVPVAVYDRIHALINRVEGRRHD